MASPCAQSFSGGSSNCITTTVSPAGVVKSDLVIRPYYPPGYVPSTGSVLNPSQLTTNSVKGIITSVPASYDPNVLTCTKLGAAVMSGKTDSLLLFKDAVSGEIKGDVIISPPPDPNDPCSTTQPNKNALHLTVSGLEVRTEGIPFTVTSDDVAACKGAYTYVDCDTNEIKVFIQVAPELLADDCRPPVDEAGNKIQINGLTCTSAGLAVLTGQGDNCIKTYVDCTTKELRAKLVIQPDEGCTAPERKGKNALICSSDGAAVLTGPNVTGGIETFRDCTSNELHGKLMLKPAPANSSCENNPNPNALRIFSDGVAVLTGASDGCVETYVDCNTEALFARLIIKPAEAITLGPTLANAQNALKCTTDGAAVEVGDNPNGCIKLFVDPATRVVMGNIKLKDNPSASNCDPAQIKNALRCTSTGLAVEVGDSTCIDMYVDCPTGEIRAVPKFDTETNKVLACSANGIKMSLATGCNGLSIKPDGLYAVPPPPAGYFGFQSDGFSDVITDTASFSGPAKSVTMANPANSCRNLTVTFTYRAPTIQFTIDSAADEFKASYAGTLGAAPIGQEYATMQYLGLASAFTMKLPGPTEVYFVNLAPGQSTTASFTPHVTLGGSGVSAVMGSYAVTAVASWQGAA